MDTDLRDATLIKALADALRIWKSQGGETDSLKSLRELVWFHWENPRLPHPRVKSNKYPVAFDWSAEARTAYRQDPKNCPIVIEHSVPKGILLRELVDGPERSAEEIAALLRANLNSFVIITKEEDLMLDKAGLGKAMPDDWAPGDDVRERYRLAGLDVSGFGSLE